MPQVKVISPPKPVIDTTQYYNESGTLQTGTTINFDAKNGIRLVLTISPDYEDRVNQWQTFEFQYSTDSGTTWNVILTGNDDPATLDAADSMESSLINTTYTTDLTIDFYSLIYTYGVSTDVRIKITDIVGNVNYLGVVTFTVINPNIEALTLQNSELFDIPIYSEIDWNNLILNTFEKFETDINK